MRTPRLAIVLVLLLAGCSPDRTTAHRPSPPSSLEPARSPMPSGGAALEALLSAEQRGDHAASFQLLSAQGRRQYRDLADWSRRRSELPPVTSFSIVEAAGTKVTALVEHPPGLDPFVGLSPARERQNWTARRERGGFLLDPEPEVQLLLPPDDEARRAAEAWAAAVQACDQPRARDLQAVAMLFGSSRGAAGLCGAQGQLEAGEVERLAPGPASADIVAQYSTDALTWARAVVVAGGSRTFRVILAPIGDTWRVVGVSD